MNTLKTRKIVAANGDVSKLTEIYRAAAGIIFERGFDATSMSDIADAVGMTKAGIYHYIPGKKDLLFALMSYAMDRLELQVIAPAKEIANAEARLQSIIDNHVRLITGSHTEEGFGVLSILTDELAGLTAENRKIIIDRKRAYFDLVRATVEELNAQGKLKKVDETVATFSIFGTIMWLSRWYKTSGNLSSEQIAEEISNILLNGMLLKNRN
jgi:TetR/AcrR family transcriptional regulator, cholesterol catabolism regulator